MDRFWDNNFLVSSRDADAHEGRFGGRATTVIKTGIRYIHPCELADQCLVLKHCLKVALAHLGLVGRVGGEYFAA